MASDADPSGTFTGVSGNRGVAIGCFAWVFIWSVITAVGGDLQAAIGIGVLNVYILALGLRMYRTPRVSVGAEEVTFGRLMLDARVPNEQITRAWIETRQIGVSLKRPVLNIALSNGQVRWFACCQPSKTDSPARPDGMYAAAEAINRAIGHQASEQS